MGRAFRVERDQDRGKNRQRKSNDRRPGFEPRRTIGSSTRLEVTKPVSTKRRALNHECFVYPKSGNGAIARGGAETRRIREDIGFGELEALTHQVGAGGQAFQQSKSPVLRVSAPPREPRPFPFLGLFGLGLTRMPRKPAASTLRPAADSALPGLPEWRQSSRLTVAFDLLHKGVQPAATGEAARGELRDARFRKQRGD